MRLRELRVINYRAVKDSGAIALCALQGFIGENNSGKSTLLSAIEVLTSSGAGGITAADFNDPSSEILIRGEFEGLNGAEERLWRSYLVQGTLTLEKRLWLELDERTGKISVKAEYHGYRAEPSDWFLSLPKIEEQYGGKVKWLEVVNEGSLPEYFLVDGKCTKSIFEKALARYLSETSVAYDEPDVSSTQALGLQSRVIAGLPAVYLLKAVSDYNAEIDRRSSTTTFRRLMGDLGDRVLQQDPRYQEIEAALEAIKTLLNGDSPESGGRLAALGKVEDGMTTLLRQLMPSVLKVRMRVATDEIREVFSRGVELLVNDGAETEVMAKGHGMQRCIVFTLLRALMLHQRNRLLENEAVNAAADASDQHRSIILLIEEPELYIHPQLCKLFYDTMVDFAKSDQVVYTTHSPLFVDANEHESITIVSRSDHSMGSRVRNCRTAAFEGLTDRKLFQGLTRLNPAVNELFFARHVLVVEGPEDSIAVSETLQALDRIRTRTEEIGLTVVVAGGKPGIPFFLRVLNAFEIPYAVLHDTDIDGDTPSSVIAVEEKRNADIQELAGTRAVVRFPVKLEASLALENHLKDQYEALAFFSNSANIPQDVRVIIASAVDQALMPWNAGSESTIPSPATSASVN